MEDAPGVNVRYCREGSLCLCAGGQPDSSEGLAFGQKLGRRMGSWGGAGAKIAQGQGGVRLTWLGWDDYDYDQLTPFPS